MENSYGKIVTGEDQRTSVMAPRNVEARCVVMVAFLLNLASLACKGMANTSTSSATVELNETEIITQETLTTTEHSRLRIKEKTLGPPHISSSFAKERFLSREPPDGKGPNCRRPAKCEKLHNTTCMGVKLPYSSTTLGLIEDALTQEQVMEKLSMMSEGLRHVPKCWAVIQPLLCSLYMPRCEDGMVDLPSQEMCKMTQVPCRILISNHSWPSFPKCEDLSTFPQKCKNDVRELKFNTTGHCENPLVQTDNSHAFYEGVEGCGIRCQDPLFTEHEQQQLYNVIAYGGTICFIVNLFTVVTFFIDWRSANKYPPLIIFYINCCFLVSCMGWLAQFMPGARQNIVCRKDGTLRMSEPSAVENLSCVIIFVLVYYPIMAALVWFVILTYAWHISFQSVGKMHENIDKKGVYFHMAAWSAPLVLTITTMALGEIDGSSVAGICFVGYMNHPYRIAFLWGPLSATVFISGYFLFRVLYTLIMLKISSQDFVSELAIAKIRKTIVRISLFSLFMLVFVITSCVCHIYEFLHQEEWKDSFRKFIICKISASSGTNSVETDPRQCKMNSRPSVSVFQLHLLVFFCAGIIMSSWVWTSSTLRTWKRFARRTFNSQNEEPLRMKKHKAIAQAFANWKTFNVAGRLSISFHSSHEDPVGLNLDVNSIASLDFSSTWAAALPTLMTRRGAVIGSATCSNATDSSWRERGIGSDSEISVSFRRVSVTSLDSQVSVQMTRLTATTKKGWRGIRNPPHKRRRRDDDGRNRGRGMGPFSRTGSSTSQDSHFGQISTALPFNMPLFPSLTPSIPNIPNLNNRRAGITGLNDFKFPLSLPDCTLDLSDDSDNKTVEREKDLVELTFQEAPTVDKTDDNCITETTRLTLDHESHESTSGVRNESSYRMLNVAPESDTKIKGSEKSLSRNSVENRGSQQGNTQERQSSFADRESEGRRSANKRKLDEIQTYQSEESDNEDEEVNKCIHKCSLPSVDIAALSESSSFCPEILRLTGANSGASVYTHHTLGGGRFRTVGVGPHLECSDIGVQVSPQEIDVDLEEIEMEELIKKRPNSPQQFVSQGVQVSPSLFTPLNPHREYIYDSVPYDEKLNIPGSQALNYTYNLQRLMQELAEGHNPLPCATLAPLQFQQQKFTHIKNGFRSRSAEDKVEGYFCPL